MIALTYGSAEARVGVAPFFLSRSSRRRCCCCWPAAVLAGVSVPVLVVARVRACVRVCTSVCVYVTRRTATAAYYHRSETFSLTFVEERT